MLKPRDFMPVGEWAIRRENIVTDRFSMWDLTAIGGNPKAVQHLWSMPEGQQMFLGAAWAPKPGPELPGGLPEKTSEILSSPTIGKVVTWTGLTSTTTNGYRQGPSVLVLADSDGDYHWVDSRYAPLFSEDGVRATWHLGYRTYKLGTPRPETESPNKIIAVDNDGNRVGCLMMHRPGNVDGYFWLRA